MYPHSRILGMEIGVESSLVQTGICCFSEQRRLETIFLNRDKPQSYDFLMHWMVLTGVALKEGIRQKVVRRILLD